MLNLPFLNNILAIASSVAAGGVVATAIANPAMTPAAYGAFGGVMTGVALGAGFTKKTEEQKAEGEILAQSFKHLYDINKGLVSPDQLSYHTRIPLERIQEFLSSLASEQQGRRIDTEYGSVYNFPHPENVLNQLTDNATNWVKARETPLMEQIALLQQTVQQLSRPAPVAPRPIPVQQQVSNFSKEMEEIQKSYVPETDPLPGMDVDPWNKM